MTTLHRIVVALALGCAGAGVLASEAVTAALPGEATRSGAAAAHSDDVGGPDNGTHGGNGSQVAPVKVVKVVYHLSEGLQQARRAVVNIRNHLNAAPDTRIVVVTHGDGIEFLLDGAQDAKGRSFAAAVGELAGQGVEFRVCNNTLAGRDISKEQVVMEASVVDSGVAEVARLQAHEGYAYLRP